MPKKWRYGLGLVCGLMLVGSQGWAADCGGNGAAKVPCSCGDTVVTSTVLGGPGSGDEDGLPRHGVIRW